MTNTQELFHMSKSNLIEIIIKLQADQKNIPVGKSEGRKDQVLKCLRSGICTIEAIAKELDINSKNVSSQLTYLRKDGHMIYSIRINNITTLKLEE